MFLSTYNVKDCWCFWNRALVAVLEDFETNKNLHFISHLRNRNMRYPYNLFKKGKMWGQRTAYQDTGRKGCFPTMSSTDNGVFFYLFWRITLKINDVVPKYFKITKHLRSVYIENHIEWMNSGTPLQPQIFRGLVSFVIKGNRYLTTKK